MSSPELELMLIDFVEPHSSVKSQDQTSRIFAFEYFKARSLESVPVLSNQGFVKKHVFDIEREFARQVLLPFQLPFRLRSLVHFPPKQSI